MKKHHTQGQNSSHCHESDFQSSKDEGSPIQSEYLGSFNRFGGFVMAEDDKGDQDALLEIAAKRSELECLSILENHEDDDDFDGPYGTLDDVRNFDSRDGARGWDHAWRETDHERWGSYPVHEDFGDESEP